MCRHRPELRSNPANLAARRIGREDMLTVRVLGSPELSGNTRVLANGQIRLPLMTKGVHVEGVVPPDAGILIANELKREQLIRDPVVTVVVVPQAFAP